MTSAPRPEIIELNTIPALLFNDPDDRWFDAYGDWNPRPDTFPGDSIEKLTAEYHRNGIHAQLWWLPLAAEMKGPKYEDHTYVDSQVVRDHPDWLILDKNGKPAPDYLGHGPGFVGVAVGPAVLQTTYYQVHLRLGFFSRAQAHKFLQPCRLCYNPKHHHKSPYDSVTAMGEVYKIIYDTTRELKPDSVTQACPCGTPPNIAWLPYMDQPVTATPWARSRFGGASRVQGAAGSRSAGVWRSRGIDRARRPEWP